MQICFYSPVSTSFKYAHQHTNDEYPGMSFLGKPVEYTVMPEQKPVTISPPSHGVSLKIPQDAVRKPANIAFKTCLSGSFKYPEGYRRLSSVFHFSSDTPFEKDVELSMEHFANIETEEQAKDMTVFSGRRSDGNDINFTPVEGGNFEVGKESFTCSLSTQDFDFLSAGAKQTSEIRKILRCRVVKIYSEKIAALIPMNLWSSILLGKRYAVLCSYSNEMEDIQRAAIAVCVDSEAYMTVCKSVQHILKQCL